MLFYYFPKPTRIGPSRYPFKHKGRSTGTQRAIYYVAMPGNPTNIGSAKMYISGAVLKYVNKRVVGPYHIPCGSMHHSFGLARAARSVEYKQRVFRIHFYSRKTNHTIFFYLRFGIFHFILPPYIPTFYHRNRGACTGINNYFFNGVVANKGIVNYCFQRNVFGASISTIAGNDKFCLCIM